MADYIVIYDPQKEIAAIVDPENRIAFGPAMIGPEAEEVLDAFLMSVPYDVAGVSSAVLRDWFEEFAQSYLQAKAAAAATAGDGQVVADRAAGVVEAARAELEATAAAGEPPAPQPADADFEAYPISTDEISGPITIETMPDDDSGLKIAPYTGPCFACNGDGKIVMVAGEPPVLCSACRGTGRLPAPVVA